MFSKPAQRPLRRGLSSVAALPVLQMLWGLLWVFPILVGYFCGVKVFQFSLQELEHYGRVPHATTHQVGTLITAAISPEWSLPGLHQPQKNLFFVKTFGLHRIIFEVLLAML